MKWLMLAISLTDAVFALAQPNPDTLWTRTYGSSSDETAYCVQQTMDGGYISTGWGWGGFRVVKLDSLGAIQWTHNYNPYAGGVGESARQTSDGGYIVAGYASYPVGGSDVFLVKLSSGGSTQWTNVFGGTGSQYGNSIYQTSDGGYIIGGRTYVNGQDIYLAKTDSRGDTLWTRIIGGSEDEVAYSVQQTTDGGYILGGYTESFGAGGYDYFLMKTDSVGDSLWMRTYGGYYDDRGYSALQTHDGGYIIAGSSVSYGIGVYDAWVVKTDGEGDTMWTRAVGGYEARSIDVTSDGGYIVAGRTEYMASDNYDIYLVKIDAFGNIQWSETYGGDEHDFANAVQQTRDEGFIIAGHTESFGWGDEDFYFVKTAPYMVSEAPQHPVPVIPGIAVLHAAYPNPFNSSTIIAFDVSSPGWVTLDVYNVLGERITRLVDGLLQPGQHSRPFHGGHHSSGIYIVQLRIEGKNYSQKLLFVK